MLGAKSVRISLLDMYLGVICIFPIATMLIEGSIINKLLFAAVLVLHVSIAFSNSIKIHTFICLLVLVVNYAFMLYNTSFPVSNINLFFYFPFYLMYTYFVCDNGELILKWFARNKMFISLILFSWSFLVGISIFIPECYYIKEGGNRYFGSFCDSIFRLGPSAVFIQVLAIIAQVLYGQKKAVLYMIIPMYCFLMGSSRTYLAIGVCLFMISWYFACKKKIVFWCTIIPVVLLVLALVNVSAMGDKIAYTLDETQYGDFWFRITSSRSVLWELDLMAWSRMPVFNKLFGGGLEFTTEVSGRWAHNDFVELLCSFGILGVLHYIYSIGHLFRSSFGHSRVPLFIIICAFMAWFCNAFFNMHYVYFCAMLCYPVLLIVINCYFLKNPVREKQTEYLLKQAKESYEKNIVSDQY